MHSIQIFIIERVVFLKILTNIYLQKAFSDSTLSLKYECAVRHFHLVTLPDQEVLRTCCKAKGPTRVNSTALVTCNSSKGVGKKGGKLTTTR